MIYVILTLLGLCMGSFVNALVWRLFKQSEEQPTKAKRRKPTEFSILHGRSMCVECRHALAAKDLLPVVSWLSLRGKCRYCQKSIAWQYPLVEAATAALFVLSYIFWPQELAGGGLLALGSWLILLVGLMALVVYDLRWLLLPNAVVYPLIAVALVQVLAAGFIDGPQEIWQALLGGLVGGGIFYVLFQVSNGRWIGGGDVKLGFLLGLILGQPLHSLLMIFLASVLGSVIAVPLLLSRRATRATRLPFGPFLIVAAVIVRLFGAAIITWYSDHFLFL